jgi:hypothetical protein
MPRVCVCVCVCVCVIEPFKCKSMCVCWGEQELAEKRTSESLSDLQKAERDSRGAQTSYRRGGGGGARRGYLEDVGSGGSGGGGKMMRPDQKSEGLRWKSKREQDRRDKQELWDRTGETSLTGVCVCVRARVRACTPVCLSVCVCVRA